MILLLTTRKKAQPAAGLARLDTVRTVRVPAQPAARESALAAGPRSTRPQRPDPDWAYRKLARVSEMMSDEGVTAVVCSDAKAHNFALSVAERHPDIPVLPDPGIASRILTELAERGIPATYQSVHDLLDPMRPAPPPLPKYLVDRSARPPLVVSLVNDIEAVASRVHKVARTLADAGYQSVVLAASPAEEPQGDWYRVGGAAVLRLPVDRRQHHAATDSPPASWPVRLLGYRSAAQDLAAWRKLMRTEELAGTGRRPPMAGRLRGRVVELRSWLYRTNQRSFLSEEHRADHHRRRARSITARFRRTDPESAFPLIGDIEEAFAPALDELKPAAIHVQDPMMLGIAVRSRNRLRRLGIDTALVFDAHEWTRDATSDHALEVSAMIGLENRLVGEMSDCVAVSQDMAEEMAARFPLSRPPTIVPDAPWSGSECDDADVRSDAGVPRGTPLVVYTGVLEPGSGVEDLVAALGHRPQLHAAVIGQGGAQQRWLRQRARQAGVASRLHFVDPVVDDKATSYLRTADAGVDPRRPAPEGHSPVPTPYRDYVVAGLPVVATDVGTSAAEIRGTGVGVVCAAGRPKALAKAIDKVLADPGPFQSRITAELQQENSWQARGQGLVQVYERLLGPAPQRRRHDGVLIGATNSAGQAYEWARSLREAGIAATSMDLRSHDNPFTHRVDHALPRAGIDTLDRKVQLLLHELVDRSAVIMESGIRIAAPETGDVPPRSHGFREARALRDSGTAVALLFHGSDIRRPDIHLRTHRWSPFANPRAAALTAELRKRTRVAHEELAAWEGPVMVSTPDLVPITPGSVWNPVVVDVNRFPAAARRHDPGDGPPVVLHMPSRSLLKGSYLIDPVLRGLAREGVIRYRRVERVPHEAVAQLFAECDIFIDQLGMGIFGVAPLEAMATGAAVITDPGPEALAAYGEDVPIVDVDPTTVESAVRDLAGDHERRRHLSQVGRDFVIRHHDGRRSAAAMAGALGLRPDHPA